MNWLTGPFRRAMADYDAHFGEGMAKIDLLLSTAAFATFGLYCWSFMIAFGDALGVGS